MEREVMHTDAPGSTPRDSSHEPVLLNEVIEFVRPRPGQFIIDGTLDGGGHASAILPKILPGGRILGLDLDAGMIANAKARIIKKSGAPAATVENVLVLRHSNYADMVSVLRDAHLPKADAVLLDLGFSSEQLDSSGRGFSFMKDEPLLMTYSEDLPPVMQILRETSEADLADIIFAYGGERYARRIAKEIKLAGRRRPIRTTGELTRVIRTALPKNYERGRIDPSTRTFQALRIYANRELENLDRALQSLPKVLKPGGRAVVITFHSLEDRAVKKAFQALVKDEKARLLAKKPVGPAREERMRNPRSRSAKIRAIEIL